MEMAMSNKARTILLVASMTKKRVGVKAEG
jgi:hypothetical protein